MHFLFICIILLSAYPHASASTFEFETTKHFSTLRQSQNLDKRMQYFGMKRSRNALFYTSLLTEYLAGSECPYDFEAIASIDILSEFPLYIIYTLTFQRIDEIVVFWSHYVPLNDEPFATGISYKICDGYFTALFDD
jgi:hypothetical protein